MGNNIYVPGGRTATAPGLMQIYNTANRHLEQWHEFASATRGGATVAFNGRVYVIAGSGSNDVFVYDRVSDSYSTGAPMPAVADVVAGVLLNGEIYVVGGGLWDSAGRALCLQSDDEQLADNCFYAGRMVYAQPAKGSF